MLPERFLIHSDEHTLGAPKRAIFFRIINHHPLPAQPVLNKHRNLLSLQFSSPVLPPVDRVDVPRQRLPPLRQVRTKLALEQLDLIKIRVLIQLVELQVPLPLGLELAEITLVPLDVLGSCVFAQNVLLQVDFELGLVVAVVAREPLDFFGLGVVDDNMAIKVAFEFGLEGAVGTVEPLDRDVVDVQEVAL